MSYREGISALIGFNATYVPFEAETKGADRQKKQSTAFEIGDYVKIFNTISQGHIVFSDRVYYLEPAKNTHTFRGYPVSQCPMDMDFETWTRHFQNHLPAKLEKNGQYIHGTLDVFFDNDTQKIKWCVKTHDNESQSSFHAIEQGCLLTIYQSVEDGDVTWEGTISQNNTHILSSYRDHPAIVSTKNQ